MPPDDRLMSKRFPRSSQYHPEWVLTHASGGTNSLWLTEWLAEVLDLRPGMRVLDLGCGRACSSIFLRREFGVEVWATDLWFSPSENIQRIRDAGVEDCVFPLHADARSLPFAPEFFDAVVCIDSFVEALARHGGECEERVQALLRRKVDEYLADPMMWLEPLVVRLAGLLRLESTVPPIVGKLIEDNGDVLNEECAEALIRIGTPAVLHAVALESDGKELREAVRAGETAHGSLEQVRSELRSAENWGTWDMLGGGSMATWAKHSKIDSAKRQAQAAQRHLRQFQEELADADQRLHTSLGEIGGFSTFADYFFDGLIADWVVQSKIQKATAACASAVGKVASALNECRRRLSETEERIKAAETERREFVERA